MKALNDLSEEEKAQLAEAKKLARELCLSLTHRPARSALASNLRYGMHDVSWDYSFQGELPEVLEELRRKRGPCTDTDVPSPRSRPDDRKRGSR
jgi:hypothetical protein